MKDDDKVGFRIFNSRNFGYWKMQVTNMPHAKVHENVLLEKKPRGVTQLVWEKSDHKALSLIRCTLSMCLASDVMKETMTLGVTNRLASLYGKPFTSNQVHFLQWLFNLHLWLNAFVNLLLLLIT